MSAQPKLHVLFTRQEIEATVSRLAAEINQDYRDKHPVLLGILKGSFMFMADLIRCLDFPLQVEFIGLSSYGKGTETSGAIAVTQSLTTPVKGRDILVIEDIVDTGHSVAFLLDYLRKKEPASVRLCALTDKPSRRQVPVIIDYPGFTVPNKFLVGYGLDFNENYRNLPEIGYLEDED
jgi:hypoxanthine phosphoribosyltransferase